MMVEQRRAVFRELRDVLAFRYVGRDETRRLAQDAELDVRLLNLEAVNALVRWNQVLEEAERSERMAQLLGEAQENAQQQGTDLELQAAVDAYMQWAGAGRPLSPREHQLKTLADIYRLFPVEDGNAPIPASLLPRLDTLLDAHALFGGRDSQLARLDQFLATQPNGYLIVTGESGFGKTALLANWVRSLRSRQQPVCYHFINRAEEIADLKFSMQNLCEQLAAYHGLGGMLPTQETTLRALYPLLLKLLPPTGQKLVVVL
ncbi:MAG TPA: hypothetical protein VGE04_10500, partial [Chloroflexia bacterium]